jgi:GxxExxY protein
LAREDAKAPRGGRLGRQLEHLATVAIDCGFRIHKELGPGLLESVYETVLAKSLECRGLKIGRQKPVDIKFDDLIFKGAFRYDLLVEDKLLIELKSSENMMPVHGKQLLTYLRLMHLPLGLLMNFGAPTFKLGLRRIVNNYHP